MFLENVWRDQCMRDERIYGRLLGEKILLLPAENHDLLVFVHWVRLRLVDKHAWLQGALLLWSLGFYWFRIPDGNAMWMSHCHYCVYMIQGFQVLRSRFVFLEDPIICLIFQEGTQHISLAESDIFVILLGQVWMICWMFPVQGSTADYALGFWSFVARNVHDDYIFSTYAKCFSELPVKRDQADSWSRKFVEKCCKTQNGATDIVNSLKIQVPYFIVFAQAVESFMWYKRRRLGWLCSV